MINIDPEKLLESVVSLTEKQDQRSLDLCLVRVLQKTLPAKMISLCEASEAQNQPYLKVVVEMLPSGIVKTDDDNKKFSPDFEKACKEFIKLPQIDFLEFSFAEDVCVFHRMTSWNHSSRFLAITYGKNDFHNNEIVANFLKIYLNHLSMINDNERDPLTGLLNRKTFEQKITKILSAQHAKQRVSDINKVYILAIIDIDHFKTINDRFGHLYGDEVLLLFARIMTKSFRGDDLLFRYGGEEFVVILNDVEVDDGVAMFERFRQAIETYHFPQVGKVTASIGVFQIVDIDIPAALIDRADQALYYAKNNGRNQVCSYENLVATGKLKPKQRQSDVELF
jgi:diguanylate cyclase (GGDEF)-like protein